MAHLGPWAQVDSWNGTKSTSTSNRSALEESWKLNDCYENEGPEKSSRRSICSATASCRQIMMKKIRTMITICHYSRPNYPRMDRTRRDIRSRRILGATTKHIGGRKQPKRKKGYTSRQPAFALCSHWLVVRNNLPARGTSKLKLPHVLVVFRHFKISCCSTRCHRGSTRKTWTYAR